MIKQAAHYQTSGRGHLYQGRFKPPAVQDDDHLLTVMRYVERNPLRAGLIDRAEDGRWSTAYLRRQKPGERPWLTIPTDPPLPRQWRAWVNKPQTEAEVAAWRRRLRGYVPVCSYASGSSSQPPAPMSGTKENAPSRSS